MKNPAFTGGVAGLALALLAISAFGLKEDAAGASMVGAILAGAVIAKALQRSLRGASSGFWHSVPGRWLIGRVAGTIIILLLLGPVYYAAKLALMYTLIGAYKIGGFKLAAPLARIYWPSCYVVTAVSVWRLRTPAKIAIGKGSRPLRRVYRALAMGAGGSSGFAGLCEEWANPWKPGLILLGASMYDRKWLVGVRDERMLCTVAANGGGKGRTAIIPNLLTWLGSVLVIDPKGQNAAVSAARRRALGQTVWIVDPMGALKEIDP